MFKEVDRDIKRELAKSIVLFVILALAIIFYTVVNTRYEHKFKEEFMLPGPSPEGF